MTHFFDHGAGKLQQQGALPHGGRAWTAVQHREQRPEEQQQEGERQPVLDADQETPDLPCETHAKSSKSPLSCLLGTLRVRFYPKPLEPPMRFD